MYSDNSKDNYYTNTTSYQIYNKLNQKKRFIHIISIFYLAIYLTYIVWRFTIINENSIIFSSLYFIAEIMGFILSGLVIFSSWRYNYHTPKPLQIGLSVDVFVPTYKEPLEIIRRTIIAAKNIKYPHQTFLLDDGKREEVKNLAQELGVIYVVRENNLYAKAGNLNNALSISKAEFILVLDADHIAMPHALDVTLGFFAEENVAMVQTPQDYYNIDAFQYMNSNKNNAIWHDQTFFYNISQPCRDSFNAASCVGTGVVYRRSALDKIGGIPTDTVTEDIHTSLKLHKAGYKIINLNESIAYGIAASDLEEYYKTRRRWAHGNLHALSLENIIFCKELSFKQKLSYLTLGLIYLEGWQQLFLFIIPLGALFFGLQPFEINIFNILIVLIFPIINYAFLQEIGSGFTRFWVNEIFAMARWPIHIISTIGIFGAKLKWRSSKKNLKGKLNLSLMIPQLSLLFFNILALVFSSIKIIKDFNYGPITEYFLSLIGISNKPLSHINIYQTLDDGYTFELFIIAGFWALYNSIKVLFFIKKVYRDSKNSSDFFRFKIPAPIVINNHINDIKVTHKISENWLEFYKNNGETFFKGDTVKAKVFMPFGEINILLKIENISKDLVSGLILWEDNNQRDILANSLYSIDWHREFFNRNSFFLTPLEFIKSILFFTWIKNKPQKNWNATLIKQNETISKYALIRQLNKSEGTLICFNKQELQNHSNAIIIKENNFQEISFCIENREEFGCLSTIGLDGVEAYKYKVKFI